MATHELDDPYSDGYDPDPQEVLRAFGSSVEKFLDAIYGGDIGPPAAMRGDWFNAQALAWQERPNPGSLGGQFDHAIHDRREAGESDNLEEHGLTGRGLRAKIGEWLDKTRAYFEVNNSRRLKHALKTGGLILESVEDALGVGGIVKEAIKGLGHLANIAVEEGA